MKSLSRVTGTVVAAGTALASLTGIGAAGTTVGPAASACSFLVAQAAGIYRHPGGTAIKTVGKGARVTSREECRYFHDDPNTGDGRGPYAGFHEIDLADGSAAYMGNYALVDATPYPGVGGNYFVNADASVLSMPGRSCPGSRTLSVKHAHDVVSSPWMDQAYYRNGYVLVRLGSHGFGWMDPAKLTGFA